MNDQSILWGSSVDLWDVWGFRLMIAGAIIGAAALVVSLASSIILYNVANVAQADLVTKTQSANFRTQLLEKEIGDTKLKAEELRAENLALQKLMQPRRLGQLVVLTSLDEPDVRPAGELQFEGIKKFAGAPLLIQVVPDFEAQTLARDVAFVARAFGWNPQFMSEAQSRVPPHLIEEGVFVTWTRGSKFVDAAYALAEGLTNAGLASPQGGGGRVMAQGLTVLPSGGPADWPGEPKLDPSIDAVIVLIGMKPIPAAKAPSAR